MAEKKENKTESLKNKLFMSNKNGYFAAKKKGKFSLFDGKIRYFEEKM